LSACAGRQITEEWGELNPNWHFEAFGAFYTLFWAAYALSSVFDSDWNKTITKKLPASEAAEVMFGERYG
jgi:hypothetical protein